MPSPERLRRWARGAAVALLLGSVALAQAAPRRVALLVGVGRFTQMAANATLEGPANDVLALKDVLVRRWQFAPADVVTLIDQQGTRAAILRELAALQQRSAPGDEVLIYLSGHGTSALDAGMGLPVPHSSGAFLPADASLEGPEPLRSLIVGRTELRPVLQALETAGRRVWVISDSCYSGQQVRSLGAGDAHALPGRMVPLPHGATSARQRGDRARLDSDLPPEPYPYRNVAFLAAASEGEVARDIPMSMVNRIPTLDGKAHGAFTNALLRVLEGRWAADADRDGFLSLQELHRAINDQLNDTAMGHTPQRLPSVSEDTQALGARPVLSVKGAVAAPEAATAEPLRLRIEGDPAPLSQALAGLPGVALAEAGQRHDVLVKAPPRTTEPATTRALLPPGRLRLLAASGDLLAEYPASDTQRLVRQLRQLGWSKQLRALAEQHRRGVLALDIMPEQYGGTFTIGQRIAFVVRTDRPATLVLVNINADGRVSVLYPAQASEAAPLPPQAAHHIPGEAESMRILVQEPEGMDFQFAFAFDERPAGLDRLFNLFDAEPDDERLSALTRWLTAARGKFTFSTTSLRTVRR